MNMKQRIISEYMAMLGRKGGRQTLKNKGKKHFSEMGKKGRKNKLSTGILKNTLQAVSNKIY